MTEDKDLGAPDVFQFDGDGEFGMKITPQQNRSKVTIENIISATGELLEEQGFDTLSTSVICERAGLTPPALYRYFPNKYAIVIEMAQRLLADQHEIYVTWIHQGGIKNGSREDTSAALYEMATSIISAIQARQAGKELCQLLRQLPAMVPIRRKVRDFSLDVTMNHLQPFELVVSEMRARRVINLVMEIFMVSVELIIDDEEEDAADATRIVCDMATNQICKLVRGREVSSGMVAH